MKHQDLGQSFYVKSFGTEGGRGEMTDSRYIRNE